MAERRQAHLSVGRAQRGSAPSGTRSPLGAPPRRLSRRPNASTQPRPRFTRTRGCGRYPHRHSRLSGAPRAPVVMPAGTMPGPPGSGVTSPARRNRTRPINRLSPVDDPRLGEILLYVSHLGTFVKKLSRHRRRPRSSAKKGLEGVWSRKARSPRRTPRRFLRPGRLPRG